MKFLCLMFLSTLELTLIEFSDFSEFLLSQIIVLFTIVRNEELVLFYVSGSIGVHTN